MTLDEILSNVSEDTETCNAVIESAKFNTERGLSAWLMLGYGGAGQGFGGYLLYAPKGWNANASPGNYCGHFVWRCLEVAGVDEWAKLAGKPLRVLRQAGYSGSIIAIGHVINDDWFCVKQEFESIRDGGNQE